MAIIGDLVVDLRANTARFEREMRKAETITGRLNARVKLASRSMQSIDRRTAGARRGTALFATALGAATVKALAYADAIGKTSRNVGLSARNFQAYRTSAKEAGVTQEQLNTNLTAFIKRIGELRTRTSSQLQTALKDYDSGLVSNLKNSKNQSEALGMLAEAIKNETDAAKRATIANAAFGRSGVNMVEFLKVGADGMDAMTASAMNTGRVLSNDIVARAEESTNELGILSDQIKIQTTTALVELGPTLMTVGEGFRDLVSFVTEGTKAFRFFGEAAGFLSTDFAGGDEDSVLARMQLRANRLAELNEALDRARNSAGKGRNKADLTGIKNEIARVTEEYEKLQARLEQIRERNSSEDPLKPTADGANNAGDAVDGLGDSLTKTLTKAERAAQNYQKFTASLTDQNKVLALTAKGQNALVPLLQAEIRAREILGRDLLPTETAELEKLIAKQNELNDSIEQQAEARVAAEQAAANARAAAEKAAEEAQRPFKQASENIQTAFGDMFTDIFRDGTDGFKDFGNTIKNIFARLAGEIAAMMVIRPVLAGIGLGGFSGMASAATGGGFLGGGGGFGNIGSVFSAGRNFLTGGLNGIADSALNPFGMAGGFLQDAFGVNALTTGLGQAIGLGGPLALLGGALGGSTGAGIGGGFGAGFSVGGPIGGAIGAVLGGLGGSLFGSKPSPPKFHVVGGAIPRNPITDNDGFARSVEGFGALGALQFSAQHIGDDNEFLKNQPFIDAVIAMDNQIAGLLGDRALSVAKQAAQSFRHHTKKSISISSVIRDRQSRIGAAIGQAGGNQALAYALQAPTSLDQLSADIELIAMLGTSIEGVTHTAGLLAQGMGDIDKKFDQLAGRARLLGLPLERLNDLRAAEKRQLEQTLGLGGVRDLLNNLTATSASPLDQRTVLGNANRLYQKTIAGANAGDALALGQLPGVANNLIGLLRNQFSHGSEFFGGTNLNRPDATVFTRDMGLYISGFDQIKNDLQRLLGIPGFSDGGITTGRSPNANMVAPVVTELQEANNIAAANGDAQANLLQQVAALLAENTRLLKTANKSPAAAR